MLVWNSFLAWTGTSNEKLECYCCKAHLFIECNGVALTIDPWWKIDTFLVAQGSLAICTDPTQATQKILETDVNMRCVS